MMLEMDRYLGCLTGLAAGDALGTTVEFQAPGTFAPVEDIVGGGVFELAPGQWTDDTSMALCLADSLLTKRGFDPADQLGRYRKWYRAGYLSSTGTCFDIGNAVKSALHRFEATGAAYCGSKDPLTAGNGSIMRLAPVVMYYANSSAEALEYAVLSSRTTHGARECDDASRLMAAFILAGLQGWSKERMLDVRGFDEWLMSGSLSGSIRNILAGSYKVNEPPVIQGTGYVVKSLEAALWAFHKSSSFAEGALLAVNLGNDADTTAAVYGQIAGAHYGLDGIPAAWRERLALRELITDYAARLYSERIIR